MSTLSNSVVSAPAAANGEFTFSITWTPALSREMAGATKTGYLESADEVARFAWRDRCARLGQPCMTLFPVSRGRAVAEIDLEPAKRIFTGEDLLPPILAQRSVTMSGGKSSVMLQAPASLAGELVVKLKENLAALTLPDEAALRDEAEFDRLLAGKE